MNAMERIRAVIDTNVVFEGLTYREGPAGTIVSAWMAELFQSCVSQALAYEYRDVLARKLDPERWARIRLVLDALCEDVQEIERWLILPWTYRTQKAAFARMRSELGSTSEEEVWKILEEREPAPPESDVGWTPELRQALEERIAAARRSSDAS
jgi:hypothetical protein